MTFEEYNKLALRTVNEDLTDEELLLNATLGSLGELGEIADHVKKYLYHGHVLCIEEMVKEIGDVLWYLNLLTKFTGYSLEEVASINITKLKKRYPDKFSFEASINRLE